MVTWQLTIDSNDPARMARFWAPLLGYVPEPPPDGFGSWLAYYQSVRSSVLIEQPLARGLEAGWRRMCPSTTHR